jgi:hypothetical protein
MESSWLMDHEARRKHHAVPEEEMAAERILIVLRTP